MNDLALLTLLIVAPALIGTAAARLPMPWLRKNVGNHKWRGGIPVTRFGVVGLVVSFALIGVGLFASYRSAIFLATPLTFITIAHDFATEHLRQGIPLRVRLERFKDALPLLAWVIVAGFASTGIVLWIEPHLGPFGDFGRILLAAALFVVLMLGWRWRPVDDTSVGEAQQHAPGDAARATRSRRA